MEILYIIGTVRGRSVMNGRVVVCREHKNYMRCLKNKAFTKDGKDEDEDAIGLVNWADAIL